MTQSVTLLAAAQADLAEAANWYRDCHPGLDADFLLCIEETLDRVAATPWPVPASTKSSAGRSSTASPSP